MKRLPGLKVDLLRDVLSPGSIAHDTRCGPENIGHVWHGLVFEQLCDRLTLQGAHGFLKVVHDPASRSFGSRHIREMPRDRRFIPGFAKRFQITRVSHKEECYPIAL